MCGVKVERQLGPGGVGGVHFLPDLARFVHASLGVTVLLNKLISPGILSPQERYFFYSFYIQSRYSPKKAF